MSGTERDRPVGLWREGAGGTIGFAVAIAVYSVAIALTAWILIPYLRIVADPTWGMDYEVYLRAATELWSDELYADRPTLPFRYPPIAAILFLPLRLLGETAGHNLLNIASVAATVLSAYCVLSWYRVGTVHSRRLLAFAVTTVFVLGTPWRTELALGQVNSILLAFIVVVVTRRSDRFRWGALLGVSVAVKLAAGIVVPGLLLLRRWRTALGAILGFLASVAIGFIVVPANAAEFWFTTFPRMSGGRPRSEIVSQNLTGALPRFDLGAGAQMGTVLGWSTLLGLTAVGLIIALRQSDPVKVTLVLGIAGLLGQPVTWTHHWVWLGPAALVLSIGIVRSPRKWPWALALVAVLATILFPVGYAMPGQSLSGTALNLWQAIIASSYVILGLVLLVVIPLCPTSRPKQPAESSMRAPAVSNAAAGPTPWPRREPEGPHTVPS